MVAVEDLRRAGATIVDPARIDGLESMGRQQGSGSCMGFKYDINRYLASHGDRVPVKSLAEIVKSGRFHPSVQRRLEQANTPLKTDLRHLRVRRRWSTASRFVWPSLRRWMP